MIVLTRLWNQSANNDTQHVPNYSAQTGICTVIIELRKWKLTGL